MTESEIGCRGRGTDAPSSASRSPTIPACCAGFHIDPIHIEGLPVDGHSRAEAGLAAPAAHATHHAAHHHIVEEEFATRYDS